MRLSWRDGLAEVTIDRPPANALDSHAIAALGDVLAEASATGASGVLLTAAGDRFFSPGGDIKELQTLDLGQGLRRVDGFNRVLRHLAELPCPVAVAANGTAVGGGMELMLAADYIVSVPSALLGLPEINHGLLPSAVSVGNAVARLGARGARDVLLSGRLFDAQEALRLGVVDSVAASPVQVRAEARAWLTEMAAKPPVLVAAMREALRAVPTLTQDERVEFSRVQFTSYFRDPGAVAARASLLSRWQR